MVKQPTRKNFDYCWPGDAKILDIQAEDEAVCITFDRFVISSDDSYNHSGKDIQINRCKCRFLEPRSTELRVWSDDKSFTLDENLEKLNGCSLEDSGDMPTENYHYLELTGFINSEWFEFRIFCDEYELEITTEDNKLLNRWPNKSMEQTA